MGWADASDLRSSGLERTVWAGLPDSSKIRAVHVLLAFAPFLVVILIGVHLMQVGEPEPHDHH